VESRDGSTVRLAPKPLGKAVGALAAILAPLALVTIIIVLEKKFEGWMPTYGNFSSLWLCLLVGVVILARAHGGTAAAWLALIYLPLEAIALVFYGLWFVGRVYGDYL
jgi:hypothetical protein